MNPKPQKCKFFKPCFGDEYDPISLNGNSVVDGVHTISPHYKWGYKTLLIYVNYNDCTPSEIKYCTPIRYAEIFVDINGDRGDSIVGKDVFMFTLFNYTYKTGNWSTSQRCPNGEHYGLYQGSIAGYWGGYCRNLEDMFSGNPGNCRIDGNGQDCGLAIEKNGWKIPEQYPIKF